ncbi:class I SAM-dependent methyltransferase [Aliifodinibius sp. S!AR15-10]|uniref:class I SAM-dependent methyltransferase n=1 Tax=Aliifodinibius sp. S!AR15-10 TaxID=2950437 RepID=UPI0038F6FBF5
MDFGCGQGRDALFIARMGHRVLGVDISKTGISQMLDEANRENIDSLPLLVLRLLFR